MTKSVSALLAAALVLTGCSTVVTGRPVAADDNGPVPVPDSALRGALLDADEVNTIMDASDIKSQNTSDDLLEDNDDIDQSCLGAWHPVLESAYADSKWSALRAELMREDKGTAGTQQHSVVQAVVAFPSRADAEAFFKRSASDWESCAERQFTTYDSDGDKAVWDFGAVEATDSTLSVTKTQQDTPGWSCQHVLRVSNNVIIDISACKIDSAEEAATITDKIDARLPSV